MTLEHQMTFPDAHFDNFFTKNEGRSILSRWMTLIFWAAFGRNLGAGGLFKGTCFNVGSVLTLQSLRLHANA